MSEIEPFQPPTQPGWYPDPAGAPVLRWHDGRQWTAHVQQAQAHSTPSYPAVPMGPAAATGVVVETGGPNHLLHLIITLLTCGLWAPVWLIVAIVQRRSRVVVGSTMTGGRQ